ncbi:pH-response regulator protein palC [Xylaria sp. CBS 124048]|nr:pH-response regulator protein palC [Xylaria sp. CBS 124048]
MPFPFVLPTTSLFSFSSSFSSPSHPSLPLNASTYRGVVKDVLKRYKRLPPSSQEPNLHSLISNINSYLPFAFAIDAGISGGSQQGEEINVILTNTPTIEWRPTISANAVPGREIPRIKILSLEYDLFFTMITLGYAYTLLARASLRPLYVTSGDPISSQERITAITTATKHLLDAASIHDYLARRAEALSVTLPCADIAQPTARALASLALAEATLLAVLKDDPYPAAVAQDRHDNDNEWMYKAPGIPKVRAHLFARLCLAAADHASQASSLCQSGGAKQTARLSDDLLRYLEDFRKTSRAKACRFFGIDAELAGQTGNALGWLQCALQELGMESRENKKGLSLSRMKKDWSERQEDKKVERSTNWGSDAGKLEEARVIEMLETKWTKINDTVYYLSSPSFVPSIFTDNIQMLAQKVPPTATLLSSLPSGRDMYTIKLYQPPELSRELLESLRALPDRMDDYGEGKSSSDEDDRSGAPTTDNYRSESTRSYF